MSRTRTLTFEIRAKRGMSNWTDGEPLFEWSGGKKGSLWVGLNRGPAWFWMTAAHARRLRDFLTECLGDDAEPSA